MHSSVIEANMPHNLVAGLAGMDFTANGPASTVPTVAAPALSKYKRGHKRKCFAPLVFLDLSLLTSLPGNRSSPAAMSMMVAPKDADAIAKLKDPEYVDLSMMVVLNDANAISESKNFKFSEITATDKDPDRKCKYPYFLIHLSLSFPG